MDLYNKIKGLGKSNKLIGEKLTICNKDGSKSMFTIIMSDSMRFEIGHNSMELQLLAIDLKIAMQSPLQRKLLFEFSEKANKKSISPFSVLWSCVYDISEQRKLPLLYLNIKVEKESNKIEKIDIQDISDCFSPDHFSDTNFNWKDYSKNPHLSCLVSLIKIVSQHLGTEFLEAVKKYLLFYSKVEFDSFEYFNKELYKISEEIEATQKINEKTLENNHNHDIINCENEQNGD